MEQRCLPTSHWSLEQQEHLRVTREKLSMDFFTKLDPSTRTVGQDLFSSGILFLLKCRERFMLVLLYVMHRFLMVCRRHIWLS